MDKAVFLRKVLISKLSTNLRKTLRTLRFIEPTTATEISLRLKTTRAVASGRLNYLVLLGLASKSRVSHTVYYKTVPTYPN